jgi:hypothetical protein
MLCVGKGNYKCGESKLGETPVRAAAISRMAHNCISPFHAAI